MLFRPPGLPFFLVGPKLVCIDLERYPKDSGRERCEPQ
jgi:hypothetical protein